MKNLLMVAFLLARLIRLTDSVTSVEHKNIIGFRDGFSDVRNYFKMSGGKDPNHNFYYQGRASNGPIWIEYLIEAVRNPNFKSFAYLLATSKTEGYNKLYTKGAPGADKQVKEFLKYYKETKEKLDTEIGQSLLFYTFSGGEFFFGEDSAETIVEQLERSLIDFLKIYPIRTVLIPTTTTVDTLSIAKDRSKPIYEGLVKFKNEFKNSWVKVIENLRFEFTDILFIEYDFNRFWQGIIKAPNDSGDRKRWITDKFCLTNENGTIKKCDNIEDYALYDDFHPTSEIHKLIAEDVLEYLKAEKNPYAKRYY